MEIEDLTKSQLVLLVVMVSFITSIATGIFTVSFLMGEPIAIHETVNKIVERTIERQVVSPKQSPSVRVVTTVPTEESTPATAAALVEPTLVEISAPKEGDFRVAGFVVSKEGLVATAASSLPELAVSFVVAIPNAGEKTARLVARNTVDDVAILQIEDKGTVFHFAVLGTPSEIVGTGQQLFSFSADDRESLVFGTLASVASAIRATSTPLKTVFAIGEPRAGAPVLTSKGTFVGIWNGEHRLIRAERLRTIIEAVGLK